MFQNVYINGGLGFISTRFPVVIVLTHQTRLDLIVGRKPRIVGRFVLHSIIRKSAFQVQVKLEAHRETWNDHAPGQAMAVPTKPRVNMWITIRVESFLRHLVAGTYYRIVLH